MGQVTGKGGAIGFGLAAPRQIDLDEWSVDDKADVILTKSFRLLGRTAADGAFADTLIAFKGYYSQAPTDSPVVDFGLKDGNLVADLCLYITTGADARSGLLYHFPQALVLTAKNVTKVDGRVDIDCTLVPTVFPFHYPGDVIP